jgi:two-component system CheB/CheR fusion protein
VAGRVRELGLPDLGSYRALLEARPAEWDELDRRCRITISRFFRDRAVWEALARDVLPALGPLPRAWSAGCASGEEAYTLAIVLSESVGAAASPVIAVDGTDVDPGCLRVAREGRYHERALADVPPEVRDRWTTADGDHRRVLPRLRSRIRFHEHDLGREPPPSSYDVITCRNVLIYFERASQERVLARFVDALRPGGLLLLGKVEMLVGSARETLETVDGRERLFRRRA